MPHSINNIPVIYFHSIAPKTNKKWSRHFLTLPLQQFISFLEYLKRNRWKTILLDEYSHLKKNTGKQYPKVCCLTFDDGFLDNFIYVYPLLKQYQSVATIFVNPEFVDNSRPIVKTLDDVSYGIESKEELMQWGYLSWEEMRLMQKSGIIDIQAHTLSHTKYYISDELANLHHPGADCLYPIGNMFPERKAGYINDPNFESLLPYGTPFFKEESAVIARRVFINSKFNEAIVETLHNFNWNQQNALEIALNKIKPIYTSWKNDNNIIIKRETEDEYLVRAKNEILLSKKIIEQQLNKSVEFLCWPHGDNNAFLHEFALEAGYKMTTIGKASCAQDDQTRIVERMGIDFSNTYKKLKTICKLKAFAGYTPYSELLALNRKFND